MNHAQLIVKLAERSPSEWLRVSTQVADPDYLFDCEYDQSTAPGSIVTLSQEDRAAFVAAVKAIKPPARPRLQS